MHAIYIYINVMCFIIDIADIEDGSACIVPPIATRNGGTPIETTDQKQFVYLPSELHQGLFFEVALSADTSYSDLTLSDILEKEEAKEREAVELHAVAQRQVFPESSGEQPEASCPSTDVVAGAALDLKFQSEPDRDQYNYHYTAAIHDGLRFQSRVRRYVSDRPKEQKKIMTPGPVEYIRPVTQPRPEPAYLKKTKVSLDEIFNWG